MASLNPLIISFKSKEYKVEYNPHSTVKAFMMNAAVALHLNPNRLRITYSPSGSQPPIPLVKESSTLQEYQIPPGAHLVAKDLGLQIGYRTVFVAEYLGPLFAFLLFFQFPTLLHRFYQPTYIHPGFNGGQLLALLLWVLHYVKRLLETVYIHKFSHATMPIFNLLKNCSYYWGFAAAIAYVISDYKYTPPPLIMKCLGVLIWLVGECCNLICHLHLSTLRKGPNDTSHPVPTHFFFTLVVCPNYLFEIVSWLGFNIVCVVFSSFHVFYTSYSFPIPHSGHVHGHRIWVHVRRLCSDATVGVQKAEAVYPRAPRISTSQESYHPVSSLTALLLTMSDCSSLH
jgi:very-long-chain enoyl-CoA reductase